jgi:A/G-specific adenine glycosylase
LRAWSGLGYNRRAKFLHEAARRIINEYGGQIPLTAAELMKLPGIGSGTAGAILVYAYDQPATFIETNVRTVFIHHFFHDEIDIPDKSILKLVEQTIDTKQPREWYWALMDYGSHLKRSVGNLGRHSKSYSKQSEFKGSVRQVRGRVLRSLGEKPKLKAKLHHEIPDERLEFVLAGLISEGMIRQHGNTLSL